MNQSEQYHFIMYNNYIHTYNYLQIIHKVYLYYLYILRVIIV